MNNSALAQELITTTPGSIIGKGIGLGPIIENLFAKIAAIQAGPDAAKTGAIEALRSLTAGISNLIAIITVGAGIWFFFMVLIGGIQWLVAGGDKQSLSNAQNKIINALIGLLIVVFAWAFVSLAGTFFEFDILINHPDKLIDVLTPK